MLEPRSCVTILESHVSFLVQHCSKYVQLGAFDAYQTPGCDSPKGFDIELELLSIWNIQLMTCLQENPAVRLVCRIRRGHSPSVRFHSVLCLLDFRPGIIFWNFLQAPLPRHPYAHHTHRLVRVGPGEERHVCQVSRRHFTGLGSPLPVVSPLPSCWREARRPYR